MDRQAAKAELAADILEAFAIALSEFPLRTLLQTADGNHDKAHECCSAVLSARALCARASSLHALQPIRIG